MSWPGRSFTNKSLTFFPNFNLIFETEINFLEIVDLWYDLKGKCTAEGLDQAVEKLDEVFPLFNTSEEE